LFGRRLPDRLDLYMLRLLAGPLVLVLATVLITQLLERVLRLLDVVGTSGAPLSAVLIMVASLVPHYLGLALPASFTAAMFMTLARLGDDSELDVMLAAGRSMTRLAVPYFALSLVFCAFSFYLFGYLQPLSRYAYHVAEHDALETRWDARIEDKRFVSAGSGFTLSADSVEPDGRQLHGVFVQRRIGAGEEVTTARQGRLVAAPDGRLLLQLDNGQTVRTNDKSVSIALFASGVINADFTPGPQPFRPRGGSVRELTLPELWQGMHDGNATLPQRKLAGEFQGRLARSLLLPLLPLLALPLGIASKRGRRGAGVAFGALALLALNHALQFGESLAESGRVAALPAVWTPIVLFAILCLWIFRGSLAWPGDNPVSRAVRGLESGLQVFGRRLSAARR
jgi:lipopolysaccharide export system permease protein